jgi:hypothetical protein
MDDRRRVPSDGNNSHWVYVATLGHIILIPSQPVFALSQIHPYLAINHNKHRYAFCRADCLEPTYNISL